MNHFLDTLLRSHFKPLRHDFKRPGLAMPLAEAALVGLTLLAVSVSVRAAEPAPSTLVRPLAGLGPPATHPLREAVRRDTVRRTGSLAQDQTLRLDLVLALRDPDGLEAFLGEVNDPASPQYRHVLSVAEFARRFSPAQGDYEAVLRFATAHGLKVVGGSREGMDVQVEGSVARINQALNVNLLTYRHPQDNREFYAPDREPSTTLPFALWHIAGLDNYRASTSPFSGKTGTAKSARAHPASLGAGPGIASVRGDLQTACDGSGSRPGAGPHPGLFADRGAHLADADTHPASTGRPTLCPARS